MIVLRPSCVLVFDETTSAIDSISIQFLRLRRISIGAWIIERSLRHTMKLILLAILATICGLCAATTKETEETGNGEWSVFGADLSAPAN